MNAAISSMAVITSRADGGRKGNGPQNQAGESCAQQATLRGAVAFCQGTRAAKSNLSGKEPNPWTCLVFTISWHKQKLKGNKIADLVHSS